jgi:hypothetical protein
MSSTMWGRTSSDDAAQLRHTARQVFTEIPADAIERRPGGPHRDGYVVDGRTGALYVGVFHTVMAGGHIQDPKGAGADAFFMAAYGEPVFLCRVTGYPSTVDELEAQTAEHERQRAAKREEQRAEYQGLPRRPVLLSDRLRRRLPTLRAAVETLGHHGAEITAQDGELVVALNEKLHNSRHVKDALDVVYAAKDVVIAELERGGKAPLAERLPDAPVRAGGGCA